MLGRWAPAAPDAHEQAELDEQGDNLTRPASNAAGGPKTDRRAGSKQTRFRGKDDRSGRSSLYPCAIPATLVIDAGNIHPADLQRQANNAAGKSL